MLSAFPVLSYNIIVYKSDMTIKKRHFFKQTLLNGEPFCVNLHLVILMPFLIHCYSSYLNFCNEAFLFKISYGKYNNIFLTDSSYSANLLFPSGQHN